MAARLLPCTSLARRLLHGFGTRGAASTCRLHGLPRQAQLRPSASYANTAGRFANRPAAISGRLILAYLRQLLIHSLSHPGRLNRTSHAVLQAL